MPITFPSHAAAVLPLKVWRPRRSAGAALLPFLPGAGLPHTAGSRVLIVCVLAAALGAAATPWRAASATVP